MILETTRLYLRALEESDLDVFAGILSNPEVMKFTREGKTLTKTQAEKSIKGWNEYEKEHGFTNWAVIRKEDEALTGKCGFNMLPDNSDIEISYMLDEPYFGKGYASEISKAALEYGFDKLGFGRVAAQVYPQNFPGIRVIEKLGMKFEKETEYRGIKLLKFGINKEQR